MPLVVNSVLCWVRSKRKNESREREETPGPKRFPNIGFIKQSNTHSQPESDCENLSVSVHTQSDDSYVEVCMHRCVDSLSFVVSLALSLARALSPLIIESLSLFPKYACSAFLLNSLLRSLSHALPSNLSPDSISLSFPRSLSPSLLSNFIPLTLSSCPQPLSLDCIRARAYVFTLKSQIIFGDRQFV